MDILGIIPARGGSKGIPKKNIKLLKGKPLIFYTIEAAKNSNLSRVVVSTDCNEIAEVSANYGVEVIKRPAELAKDETPTLPVLQHAVNKMADNFDAVMTLQPTSPLRNQADINEAIATYSADIEVDSLVSVVEVPHIYMPEKLMELDGNYLKINEKIKRRQEVSTKYARNGAAIYITRKERLNDYILGGKILPYFMTKLNSFDIDDYEDWEIIERLIR
ncbi:acylneuraminate cytidylyltransferase family protein [Vibrio sp. OCN044]|uniref:Acylneuraminate cytidylyltransferase family protein n=1 Tax=Vibrio tetraodonis subsp. pristinus TaxID=2695891 RepID=A0A6L8LXA3_9VIBR|nr:acylneuraminate cytidylyltransferase family protein [Vibrio tetraodonis]MYM60754.1 acylneuraminate cytidylyltransferase family protein [Vibrio tetraodonis subsp. pristinus]